MSSLSIVSARPDHRAAQERSPEETPMIMRSALSFFAGTAALLTIPTARAATEIRVACYSDGNECEATQALLPKFGRDHPDVKVIIDKQAYKSILESLPVQLAAGQVPDIARTTDFGIISQYFLDLRPLIKD